MIADFLPWLYVAAWIGLLAYFLGAWARRAWRSPAYRPHAAATPTDRPPAVSACLCAATCHARPCLTYTKEHAYR